MSWDIVQSAYLPKKRPTISAFIGAVVALLLSQVSIGDLATIFALTGDATVTLIAILIFSIALNEIKFFDYLAWKIIHFSNGDGRKVFVYILFLTATISAIFTNDSAVLIFAPIVLAKMRLIKIGKSSLIAFLFAVGFISDSSSLLFSFSNLTNIISVNFFGIDTHNYLAVMMETYIFSTIFSVLFLYLLFKNQIPKELDLINLKKVDLIRSNKILSYLFIVVALSAYLTSNYFGIKISVVAMAVAVIFLAVLTILKAVNPKDIFVKAPWHIVVFSFSLFVVVYGLKNSGVTLYLTKIIDFSTNYGEFVSMLTVSYLATFISAIANNLPANLIMNISLEGSTNQLLIYANIVGTNIGAKLTPIGSLATLLWLDLIRKNGVEITVSEYMKKMTFLTLLTVFVATAVLYLTNI